jgi:hypothetical protein
MPPVLFKIFSSTDGHAYKASKRPSNKYWRTDSGQEAKQDHYQTVIQGDFHTLVI